MDNSTSVALALEAGAVGSIPRYVLVAVPASGVPCRIVGLYEPQ